MYEFMDCLKMMSPGIYEDFPKLKAFLNRFENLPRVKAYMESSRFQRTPVFNKFYGFQGP